MADSTRLNVSGLFEYVKTLTTDQDDEIAKARDAADLASDYAIQAGEAAAVADGKAEAATSAAGRAETAANSAVQQAGRAESAANSAVQQAGTAATAADSALTQAGRAESAANSAVQQAGRAESAANNAVQQAGRAESAANTANYAANSALIQASIVEDVAGTLAWIQDHGSYVLTTDTEIQNGSIYFEYDETTQDYVPIVSPDPEANPAQEGWYKLDISDSQSEFVMSHLAVTQRGLWVLPSGLGQAQTPQYGPNYKVLLSSDGMYVYDGSGALVSTFGESITFSSNKAQYIGGDNAYIVFNPTTGTMSIGGNQVTFSGNISVGGSSRSLSQVLEDMQADIDGSIETWYYAVDPTTTNEPAVNWTTTTEKQTHLRDLYFNTTNGHSFRWAYANNEYKWIQIEDTDLAALSEDLNDTKDSSIAQEQRIYKQFANKTTPSPYPTTPTTTTSYWVTYSGESVTKTGDTILINWTTKPPTFNTDYPYVFTAKQTKTVSGIISCSQPMLDDSLNDTLVNEKFSDLEEQVFGTIYYKYQPTGSSIIYDVWKDDDGRYWYTDGDDEYEVYENQLIVEDDILAQERLNGMQQTVDILSNSVVADDNEGGSLTIVNPYSIDKSSIKITDSRISFKKVVLVDSQNQTYEEVEVAYIDSDENEGVIDINNARIHDSIRIGNLEIIEASDGGIAIRRST